MRSYALPAAIPFAGREAELAALTRALDAAIAGQGGLALLAGEPGIGKTRLAEELAAIARRRGASVLWGRCYEGEGAPAFWPWIEVLRAAVRGADPTTLPSSVRSRAADIAQLMPELHEVLPGLPALPTLSPEQARFRLFDAVTAYLMASAATQPLLLLLDDLHWADVPSLLLLEFLAREVGEARLLLVGTYRDVEVARGHPLARSLGELARGPRVTRLTLGGLGADDVARVVAGASGVSPSEAVLAELNAKTEGNPLFITELTRLLADRPGPQPAPALSEDAVLGGVPATVRAVIGRRLDRLSDECIRVLNVAAVAGREFGVEVLGRADDLEGEALLAALEEAEATRVIAVVPGAPGRYRFAHALIRETLYEELPTLGRARLHGQVGAALAAIYQQDVDPHLAELAWHFAQAAPLGNAAAAVDYAQRAAERAMRLHAYEEAVRYFALAAPLAADAARRCRLLLALGRAHSCAGDGAAAEADFLAAADAARNLGDARLLAQATLGLGERAVWGQSDARRAGLLEDALRALGEGDEAIRSRLLSRLALELVEGPEWERGATLHRQAVELARRAGDPPTLAAVLTYQSIALWDPDNVAERLAWTSEVIDLARQIGDAVRLMRALRLRSGWLLEIGDVAAADADIATYSGLAADLRQPAFRSHAAALQAMRALMEGRFAEGEQLAMQALTLGRRIDPLNTLQIFGVQMFQVRREQGRVAELEESHRRAVAQFPQFPAWRCGLVWLLAEIGRTEEAQIELDHLAAHGFTDLRRDANWLPNLSDLAEACALLGDASRAAALYELLLPYAARVVVHGNGSACTGSAAYYLGVLAATMATAGQPRDPATVGLRQTAEHHLKAALTHDEHLGARPYLARSQHQHAALLVTRHRAECGARAACDHLERARALADAALVIARELGMTLLASQTEKLRGEALLVAHTAAPDYPAGLTAREVEVLRLIAAGHSYKAIAAALVLSAPTVHRHTANIYAKIGAQNRAEAAAFAVRHGLTQPDPA